MGYNVPMGYSLNVLMYLFRDLFFKNENNQQECILLISLF